MPLKLALGEVLAITYFSSHKRAKRPGQCVRIYLKKNIGLVIKEFVKEISHKRTYFLYSEQTTENLIIHLDTGQAHCEKKSNQVLTKYSMLQS